MAQPGDATTAPSVPTNLAAGTTSTTSVPLTWSASTDAGSGVAGYEVYRGTTLMGTTTSTGLTVTGLTAGTAYSFTVRAKDVAGNVSDRPRPDGPDRRRVRDRHGRAERPDRPGGRHRDDDDSPAALGRLHGQQRGHGRGRLRRLPGRRARGQHGDPSYTATGLAPGTSYVFTVVAKDGAGNRSATSAALTAYTAPDVTAGSCAVTYTANTWSNGFTGAIRITNTGTTALTGWTLGFSFANGQTVTQGWSATIAQSGSAVTATGLAWNSTLAPGASTEIGFNGTHTGTNPAPTAFTVNGAACTVR